MIAYLGVHEPAWLTRTTLPLFVSRRRLQRRVTMPVAAGRWALDSGGFTELHQHGAWRLTAPAYAALVHRYAAEIGGMAWAAPQDWMCEPSALAASGLDVATHQRLTVRNFRELRDLLGELVIPVLQGWTVDDYQRCLQLYDQAGVDLTAEPLVGIGSICRRGADDAVVRVIDTIARAGVRCHAFGVRTRAMQRAADLLVSCDSMAWSRAARHRQGERGPCGKRGCQNCLHAAIEWHAAQVARLNHERLELTYGP